MAMVLSIESIMTISDTMFIWHAPLTDDIGVRKEQRSYGTNQKQVTSIILILLMENELYIFDITVRNSLHPCYVTVPLLQLVLVLQCKLET